jgi:hypothetical protein
MWDLKLPKKLWIFLRDSLERSGYRERLIRAIYCGLHRAVMQIEALRG